MPLCRGTVVANDANIYWLGTDRLVEAVVWLNAVWGSGAHEGRLARRRKHYTREQWQAVWIMITKVSGSHIWLGLEEGSLPSGLQGFNKWQGLTVQCIRQSSGCTAAAVM